MTIHIVFGRDHFFISNKTKQLIKDAAIDAFNESVYDLDEVDLDVALSDALTVPFMADKKAIVIKNAFFLSDPKAAKVGTESAHFKFLLTAKDLPTELIFQVPDKALLKTGPFKAFIASATCYESPTKKPQDLKAWVDRQLAKAQLDMTSEAYNLLIERITHDPETAYQELSKLLLYAADKDPIDETLIDRLITVRLDDNIFTIINQLLEGNKKAAYQRIALMLEAKEDALRIFNALINKFKEMMLTQSLLQEGMNQDAIQDYLNVKSGRAYYMVKNARQFPAPYIQKVLTQLEAFDIKIKTGQIDKTLALELFIFGV